MSEVKKKNLITIILGICIVLPRIVMPTYIPVSKILVWCEMFLELLIGLAVVVINKASIYELCKKELHIGRFIRNVIIIFLATRVVAAVFSVAMDKVMLSIWGTSFENFYDPALAIGKAFQETAIIPVMITQCILAPITEELVFRKAVGDFVHNKFLYIIISACLFGFIHCGMFVNISVLTYVVYGIGFNIAYLACKKDIRPVIAAHMLGNIFVTVAAVFS